MQNPYRTASAVITKIRKETKDTKTYTLKYIDPVGKDQTAFQPGQFIMISIFGYGEAPFSLSSFDDNAAFEITVRKVGSLTTGLDTCKEGDRAGVRGPYGRGWPLREAEAKDMLIVAGGIGMAPLKPVIQHIAGNRSQYRKLEILYGARTLDDMLFVDEFSSWRRIKDTNLLLTVDSIPEGVVWDHKIGVVPMLFNDMETSASNSIVMTCGPEIMMHFVARDLLSRGFREDQVFVSLERRMKCGIAQCGHCQIGAKYVCKDGPIFPYSELIGLPDLRI